MLPKNNLSYAKYINRLDDLRTTEFIPTLLQATITNQDRALYSLSVKHGGLGIPILFELSQDLLLQLLSCKDLKYHTLKLQMKSNIQKERERYFTERKNAYHQSETLCSNKEIYQ